MKILQFILFIFLILFSSCNLTKGLFFNKNVVKLIDSAPNGANFVIADNNGNLKVLISKNNAILQQTRRKGGLFVTSLRFMTNDIVLVGYEDGKIFQWLIKNEDLNQVKLPKKVKNIHDISFSWNKNNFNKIKNSLSKERVYIATNKGIIGFAANAFIKNPIKKKINLKDQIPLLTEKSKGTTRIHTIKENYLFFLHKKSIFNRKLDIQQDHPEQISKNESISIYDVSWDKEYVIFSKKNTPYILPIASKTSKKIECLQHGSKIIDIVFANNTHVFTASIDGIIKLWNIQSSQLIATFNCSTEKIFDIDYNKGKLFIASTSRNQRVIPIDPIFLMLDQLKVELDLDKTVENQNTCFLDLTIKLPSNEFNFIENKFHRNDFQLYPMPIESEIGKASLLGKASFLLPNPTTPNTNNIYKGIPIELDIKNYMKKDTITVCLGCNQLEMYNNANKMVDINFDYFTRQIPFGLNSQKDETIYPLVIAPKLSDLDYNQNDAEKFLNLIYDQHNVVINQISSKKRYKRKIINYDNQLMTDELTINEINQSIKNVGKKINKEDTFVFFISSHGIPHSNRFSKDFFIKINEENNKDLSEYSFNELLLLILKEVKCKKIILVIDACYSGKVIQLVKNLNFDQEKQTIVVLTSSNDKQTSKEVKKFEQGIFTNFLLESIPSGDNNEDKKITFYELLKSIKKGFGNNKYDQEPQICIFPAYKEKSEIFFYLN